MPAVRKSRSIVFSAANDNVDYPCALTSLRLSGTGLTVGQRVTVQDNKGSIIADHYIANANENEELLQAGMHWVAGILLSSAPAGGSWSLVARLA